MDTNKKHFCWHGHELYIIWLAPWAGKMTECCAVIGYPSGQGGAILPVRNYPLCSTRKQCHNRSPIMAPIFYIINPLLTKLMFGQDGFGRILNLHREKECHWFCLLVFVLRRQAIIVSTGENCNLKSTQWQRLSVGWSLKRITVTYGSDWLWAKHTCPLIWSCLPLILSERQSPSTVLFRTTFARTITQDELLILLSSNHHFITNWSEPAVHAGCK